MYRGRETEGAENQNYKCGEDSDLSMIKISIKKTI